MIEKSLGHQSSNTSHAWAALFYESMAPGNSILPPRCVSITVDGDNIPPEDIDIRNELDNLLRKKGKPTISETAATIFPYKHWQLRGRPGIKDFSKWYCEKYLPKHRARMGVRRRKIKDTYFARMINYTGTPKKSATSYPFGRINQLEFLCNLWKQREAQNHHPRHSAMQIAIFDPLKDHTGAAMSGFPCLQQISLGYDHDGSFSISAYYPTQYIIERAYGNYLGLLNLGRFLSSQLGLRFNRLDCIIARPQRNMTKSELNYLYELTQERIA